MGTFQHTVKIGFNTTKMYNNDEEWNGLDHIQSHFFLVEKQNIDSQSKTHFSFNGSHI